MWKLRLCTYSYSIAYAYLLLYAALLKFFINQNTLEYDDGSWICILPNRRFYDNTEKSVACLEPYDIVSNDGQIEQVGFDGLDNRDIVPAFHPTLAQYYGSFEMPWLIHKIKTLQNQTNKKIPLPDPLTIKIRHRLDWRATWQLDCTKPTLKVQLLHPMFTIRNFYFFETWLSLRISWWTQCQ